MASEASLRLSAGLTLAIHGREIMFPSGLTLAGGELALLTGPTGSGKTSFMTALAGLADFQVMAGRLDFEPGDRPVAVVTQNPDLQTLGASVWEDTLSGALNYGSDRVEAEARASCWLSRLGLAGLENETPEQLSAGQRERLALAAALTLNPGWLMLDEPLGQLDSAGRLELATLLAELKDQGLAILIIEHHGYQLQELADHRCELKSVAELLQPPADRPPASRPAITRPKDVLEAANLSLAWPGPARPLLVDDFIIREGQTIGLTGPNGSGKSSFFAALAGLGPERAGALRWFGQGQAKPADLVGRVGFLSQNPERQFFNETVREEVSFVLHRQNRPAGEAVGLADKWLGRLGLGPAAGQRPQELSFGQQHLLGLAMILASEPALLVLDEPFTGLDDGWRAYLKPFLSRGWPDYQPAVLILGHDEPAGLELDEIWRFQEGRVVTGQSASLSRPVAAIAEKRPPKRRFGYPGQYQPGHSRLHGCSPAWKFILMTLLASAAILTRSPWISLGVGLITAGLAASAGLAGAVFRDFKLLLLPVPLMVLFYCLRFSFDWSVVAEALAIGGRLIAAGLPFLLLQRSTDPERLQKSLKRFLSARNAFLLAAGAKIAPLIFRETLALAGLQRLRGARLYCKKIFRKEVINDWLMAFCLPLIIRVLELADQMSVIARLRGLEGNPAAPIHAQSGPQAPGEE